MRFGASLVLIAIGATLKFAVTKQVSGINLPVVGVVLMVVGVIGLVLTLILMSVRRRSDVVVHPGRTTYVEPANAVDPRY